jgi:hypothetical protein
MVNDAIILWIDNGNGAIPNPGLSQDEFDAGVADLVAQNRDALWQSATNYETSFISGSATRLVNRGVVKGLPKSIAVDAWIDSIWSLYYSRITSVSAQWDSALYDFTSCGPMPYTIPEIKQELE